MGSCGAEMDERIAALEAALKAATVALRVAYAVVRDMATVSGNEHSVVAAWLSEAIHDADNVRKGE